MVFTNVLLILGTCINSTQSVATASNYDNFNSSAEEIINSVAQAYDYSNYDLTLDAETSLSKQKLLSFLKNDELVSSAEYAILNRQIKNASDYYQFDNIDSVFIREGYSERLASSISNFKTIMNDDTVASPLLNGELTTINSGISTCGLDDMSVYGGGGGSPTKKTYFPVYSYDTDNVCFYENGKLNGYTFFGFAANKDTCIGFYNTIVNFFTRLGYYNISSIKGPAYIAWMALSMLSAKSFTIATILTAAHKVGAAFAGIFSEIGSFFATLPPFGAIFATIIIFVGVACAFQLAMMFVCGYLNIGFAMGWMVKSIFNWEWYLGEVS